jgi:hypothetical protein
MRITPEPNSILIPIMGYNLTPKGQSNNTATLLLVLFGVAFF